MFLVVLALCLPVPLGLLLLTGVLDDEQVELVARPMTVAAAVVVLRLLRWMFGDTLGASDDARPVRTGWLLRIAPSVMLYTFGGILLVTSPIAREDMKVTLAVAGVVLLVVAEVLRRLLRPGRIEAT